MTDTDFLQKGQAALIAENYTEAIEFLEACCAKSSKPQSQTYLKAQMSLVKAYHQTQQSEKAIALCHELAQSPNLKLQTWANQALQTCSIQTKKFLSLANCHSTNLDLVVFDRTFTSAPRSEFPTAIIPTSRFLPPDHTAPGEKP